MTRARIPPGPVMQEAYGILDKYKISRTFFVRTDQEGCALAASDINAANGITAESTVAEATGSVQKRVFLPSFGKTQPEQREEQLQDINEPAAVVNVVASDASQEGAADSQNGNTTSEGSTTEQESKEYTTTEINEKQR